MYPNSGSKPHRGATSASSYKMYKKILCQSYLQSYKNYFYMLPNARSRIEFSIILVLFSKHLLYEINMPGFSREGEKKGCFYHGPCP